MFLSGSNAGGYTALQAACVTWSPLTVVTAISAIIDPAGWAVTAPRFQCPHARALASGLRARDPRPGNVYLREAGVLPAIDRRLTEDDIRALITSLGDLHDVIRNADAATGTVSTTSSGFGSPINPDKPKSRPKSSSARKGKRRR